MFSEEETELRDLIMQNLENSGFLNKIKAELRAGVFLALEEDGNLKNKIPLFNNNFDDFASTTEGKLILSLVRDFLEYFNLHFTLSVFDPEISITSPCLPRSEICKQLKLNSDVDGPVLSRLVKDKINIDNNLNSAANFTEERESEDNKTSKSAIIESTSEEKIQALSESCALDNNPLVNNNKSENVSVSSENYSKDLVYDSELQNKISSNKTVIDGATEIKSAIGNDNILKENDDILAADHDPFFDEPLPSEKPSFFSFTEILKDKSESKLTSDSKQNVDESKVGGLSSLKDLPSLSTSNEWTFSRDNKNMFPSLESQKSISSSETSNEEIVNFDSKEGFQKRDSDIAESNEESSEKPISEESIEEEIDDEFSATFEDLLNSSLSLADDVTTDQTVSQTSVVDGVDHVEPCK